MRLQMYIGLRGPADLSPSLARQVPPVKRLCNRLGAAVHVIQATLGCPQSSRPPVAAAWCRPPWLQHLSTAASTKSMIKSL